MVCRRRILSNSMKEEQTLEQEVERVRRKRARFTNHDKLRTILNTVFMLLAVVGLVVYFMADDQHVLALGIIAFGMLFKIFEFILRFFF